MVAKMKLLVIGSKKVSVIDLSIYIPADTELIITGEHKGIEAIAQKYADDHKIKKLIYVSDHVTYGKNAIYKRNKFMVNEADEVLIFWDGKTNIIKETADYAVRKGKNVTVIFIE